MPMYKVQARFESCELKFKIANPDQVTPALEKKFKTLGFPGMWAVPAAKKIDASAGGVAVVSDDAVDMSKNIPIAKPAEDGKFECVYCADDKSVSVKLSGTFDVWTTDDVKLLKSVACLYIDGVTLQDGKGKEIKYPKDEYGMSSPVRANVTGGYQNVGKCYQVPVEISLIKA